LSTLLVITPNAFDLDRVANRHH